MTLIRQFTEVIAKLKPGFRFFCTPCIYISWTCDTGAVGPSTVFWFYSVACVVAVVFIAAFVPETKDKSLEQVNDAIIVQQRLIQRMYAAPTTHPEAVLALARWGGGQWGGHNSRWGMSRIAPYSNAVSLCTICS